MSEKWEFPYDLRQHCPVLEMADTILLCPPQESVYEWQNFVIRKLAKLCSVLSSIIWCVCAFHVLHVWIFHFDEPLKVRHSDTYIMDRYVQWEFVEWIVLFLHSCKICMNRVGQRVYSTCISEMPELDITAICLYAVLRTSVLLDTKSTICSSAIPRYIWHINHILFEKQTTMLTQTTFVMHHKVPYRTRKYVSLTHACTLRVIYTFIFSHYQNLLFIIVLIYCTHIISIYMI